MAATLPRPKHRLATHADCGPQSPSKAHILAEGAHPAPKAPRNAIASHALIAGTLPSVLFMRPNANG
jgi:hypothetical protein